MGSHSIHSSSWGLGALLKDTATDVEEGESFFFFFLPDQWIEPATFSSQTHAANL